MLVSLAGYTTSTAEMVALHSLTTTIFLPITSSTELLAILGGMSAPSAHIWWKLSRTRNPIRRMSPKRLHSRTSHTLIFNRNMVNFICPGNICPGNICPYQQCLSCYQAFWTQFLGALIILDNIFLHQTSLDPNIFWT